MKKITIDTLLINEHALRDFVETTFPTLVGDEVLIYFLLARKKYCNDINLKIKTVKPFISYFNFNDVDTIMRRLKRTSLIGDFYVDKDGTVIPPRACALYVNLTPKSVMMGYNDFVKHHNDIAYTIMNKGIDLTTNESDTSNVIDKKIREFTRMKVNIFSSVHKSTKRKPYYLVDIDEKDEDMLEKVLDMLNRDFFWVSETRGGYHVLVKKGKQSGGKVWIDVRNYNTELKTKRKLTKNDADIIEIKSDVTTPAVGTLQGGFEVKRLHV